MAKKHSTRSKAKQAVTAQALTPEAALIAQCVEYTMARGALSGAFEGDPVGKDEAVDRAVPRLHKRCRAAITALAGMKANTPAGISAKARVLKIMARDDLDGLALDSIEHQFITAFAADVSAFADDILRQQWDRERQAKLAAGQVIL